MNIINKNSEIWYQIEKIIATMIILSAKPNSFIIYDVRKDMQIWSTRVGRYVVQCCTQHEYLRNRNCCVIRVYTSKFNYWFIDSNNILIRNNNYQ